jgi:deoxyadenosine/deoxycytidine kinase
MFKSIISIEGNIGSGKSTLLANLKEHYKNNPNVIFLKEPVDEWEKIKDENGITILEKFYSDQEKYSFPFQMMAYISRLMVLRNTLKNCKTNKDTIIITERSLYTDKMVFAKMLYDSCKIESINYQIYLNWFDAFSNEFPVDKIIYVKTDSNICHERIMKRSRTGENNIPLDYLETCYIYHEDMIRNLIIQNICKEQMVLDGNVDIFNNNNQLDTWIKEIGNFINK